MPDEVFGALRVIDCASYVAGPASATVFADLGAEVIKIEPLDGDPLRRLAPVDPSYFWRMDARSKKGLAIDLKHPSGREVLERLLLEADVFITNYRDSLIERLALQYETLAQINPRLVYGQITGYGLRGEEADRTAFDSTAWWGRSGMQDWVRHDRHEPAFSAPGMGDHATSMALFGAVAAALYRREKTGKGSRVYTSLMANGAWSHSMSIQAAAAGAAWATRHPARPEGSVNINQIYRTADDRRVFLSVLNPAKEYQPLLRSLGLEKLTTEDRFADFERAYEHMGPFVAAVETAIERLPLTDVRQRFDAHGITYGFVQRTSEVLEDPQMWANEVMIDVAEPVEEYDRTVASPIWIDGVEKVTPRLAPEIGEHNREILAGLGYSDDDIAAMREQNVIT